MKLRLVHSVQERPAPECSTCHSPSAVVLDKGERYHCGRCNMAFTVAPRPATQVRAVE